MNPGVFAVVSFYILSGYVVTHLWDNIFPEKPNRLWFFYRDRILRIFPLYLYVFSVTLAFVFFTGYGQPDFVPSKLLANAFIVPLNYFMWYDTTILTDPAWCLIPPAWSLGAEEQAYLLLSVLLVVRPLKYLLAPASLVCFYCCVFGMDSHGLLWLPALARGVFYVCCRPLSMPNSLSQSDDFRPCFSCDCLGLCLRGVYLVALCWRLSVSLYSRNESWFDLWRTLRLFCESLQKTPPRQCVGWGIVLRCFSESFSGDLVC